MYYFIGIKGSGMSALASILFDLGYEVSGSDVETHFFTEEGLTKRGINILPYSADNLKEGMIVVRGNAINDNHEEVLKAIEMDLTIHTYQEMVAKLTRMFKTIAVAGCHGKTSTTSMFAHVLEELAGANYLIGDGTGSASRENKYFVLEACEYKRHFLEYNPYYAIITNIELDHVDYFKNIDDVIDAYQEYADNAEKMAIVCGDDRYTHSLEISKPIFYYGLDDDNDIIAKDVNFTKNGISFDVFVEENYYGHFDLPLYGKHQLLNALAVISVCYYERLEAREVSKILKTFEGAKRRFSETVIGENVVIDDYAHHPTELKVTIKAARQKYEDKKIIAIFQPHTFTRTNEFKDDYIQILNGVDKAYIMDIHGSRESEELITSEDLIKEISGAEHINLDESDKLLEHENAVLLFMSPNDISKLENDYIDKKSKTLE
ncbi:MAG: UDP-N-acetylmuramate--L-alanine ligase [Bacilli bacterium]|nr:UDP-N-acetylmuramate--L-alanine ligase [Bacilli bacterium]